MGTFGSIGKAEPGEYGSPNGRVKRSGRRTVAVALVLTVLASCSGSANGSVARSTRSGEKVKGVAVDRAALLGPGTEVGNGLKVPAGASLVGTTFPYRPVWSIASGEDLDTAWKAVLLVDGSPLEVWNAVVEQIGLADGAKADGACVVWADPGPSSDSATSSTEIDATKTTVVVESVADLPVRSLRAPAQKDDSRLQCEAEEGDWTLWMVAGVQDNCLNNSIGPEKVVKDCGRFAQRHLVVQRQHVSPPNASNSASYGGSAVSDDPPTGTEPQLPPMPEDVSEAKSWLPAEGEQVDAGLDYQLDQGAMVSKGAKSVVAPALMRYCTSGLVAVLDSPLEPLGALDSIQMRNAENHPPARSEVVEGADENGRKWASFELSSAGGYYINITAIERTAGDSGASSGSWVLADECGD